MIIQCDKCFEENKFYNRRVFGGGEWKVKDNFFDYVVVELFLLIDRNWIVKRKQFLGCKIQYVIDQKIVLENYKQMEVGVVELE